MTYAPAATAPARHPRPRSARPAPAPRSWRDLLLGRLGAARPDLARRVHHGFTVRLPDGAELMLLGEPTEHEWGLVADALWTHAAARGLCPAAIRAEGAWTLIVTVAGRARSISSPDRTAALVAALILAEALDAR